MVNQLLKSVGLTVVVSGCVGLFLTNFNLEFWSSFVFVTVIQIVGWNIFQYIQERNMAKFQAEQDQQFFANLAKQSASLPCQACKKESLVPIRLDDVNTFDCDHCKVTNAVYVDISTAITTTPLTKLETIRINETETT